jgi:hypothetical protein
VVFEYSTEALNAQSQPPFTTYGDGNYGVGFFEPDDCDDIDIPCSYVPFPQFDTLAEKYAAVDATDEPGLEEYVDIEMTLPVCPSRYLPLSSFTWASAEIEDLACPSPVFVFCPGVPAECSNLGMSLSPPTQEPTTSVEPTSTTPNPSNAPSTGAKGSEVPTTQPSGSPESNSNEPSLVDSPSDPSNAPSTGAKDSEVPTTQPSGSPESNSNEPSLVDSPSDAPSAFPSSSPSQKTSASNRSVTPQPSDTARLAPTSSAGRRTGWHWFAFASLVALLKC